MFILFRLVLLCVQIALSFLTNCQGRVAFIAPLGFLTHEMFLPQPISSYALAGGCGVFYSRKIDYMLSFTIAKYFLCFFSWCSFCSYLVVLAFFYPGRNGFSLYFSFFVCFLTRLLLLEFALKSEDYLTGLCSFSLFPVHLFPTA